MEVKKLSREIAISSIGNAITSVLSVAWGLLMPLVAKWLQGVTGLGFALLLVFLAVVNALIWALLRIRRLARGPDQSKQKQPKQQKRPALEQPSPKNERAIRTATYALVAGMGVISMLALISYRAPQQAIPLSPPTLTSDDVQPVRLWLYEFGLNPQPLPAVAGYDLLLEATSRKEYTFTVRHSTKDTVGRFLELRTQLKLSKSDQDTFASLDISERDRVVRLITREVARLGTDFLIDAEKLTLTIRRLVSLVPNLSQPELADQVTRLDSAVVVAQTTAELELPLARFGR